jgi:hypothetical protein
MNLPNPEAFQPRIDRVVETGTAATIGAMATMLYGLPRPIDRVDAITVYPGLGEYWRIQEAVAHWQNPNGNASHLLVAAAGPDLGPDMDELQAPPVNLARTDNVHTQLDAQNTPAQAEWLADKTRKLGIGSVALVAPPYHLLRAYLTTLKVFERKDVGPVPIIPIPVAVAPDTIIPETGKTAWEMETGEEARIQAYTAKGDLATPDEFKDYLKWLAGHSIMGGLLRGGASSATA